MTSHAPYTKEIRLRIGLARAVVSCDVARAMPFPDYRRPGAVSEELSAARPRMCSILTNLELREYLKAWEQVCPRMLRARASATLLASTQY